MPQKIRATSVVEGLRSQSILLTGATGFLARAVLEKILRAVPDVERLYLLVRPGRAARAAERLEREVLNSSIFDYLRRTQGERFTQLIRDKIVGIEGDLAEDRLGLTPAIYAQLSGNVTCIINSAAACSFGEQLDHALQVNTLGPGRLLQFAKDAGDIPLLHISTCYANGNREGDVEEEVLPLGHTVATVINGLAPVFDLDSAVSSMLDECASIRASVADGDRDDEVLGDEYRALLPSDRINRMRQVFADRAVVDLGRRMAQSHGWSDTYPFTKALGEQLVVRERGGVPLTVLRPSIIEGSFEEPVPGWIDGMRMADPVITEAGKGNLPEFVGRSDTTLDLIPCDMVVNAALASMPPAGAADHCRVYQISSSELNPLQLTDLSKFVQDAYSRWPARDRDGRTRTPTLCKWISGGEFKRKLSRQIRQARLMRDLDRRFGFNERARRINQRLRVFERLRLLAEYYGFYTSHNARFLTANTQELYASLGPADQALFPFDVTRIDWREYIVERHVPGLQRMANSKNGPRNANQRTALQHVGNASCVYDLFERAATAFGERTATQIRSKDERTWIRYSYRQLLDAAAHVHAQLAKKGLQAGDRVVIYSESTLEWGLAYLGLQRAGLVPIPLDPHLSAGPVFDAARRTDAKLILAGRHMVRNLEANGGNGHTPAVVSLEEPFIPSPQMLPTREGAAAPPKRAPRSDQSAWIVFSNGAADESGISMSHDRILADIRRTIRSDNRKPAGVLRSTPQMHDNSQFSSDFVSPLVTGACVTYFDEPVA